MPIKNMPRTGLDWGYPVSGDTLSGYPAKIKIRGEWYDFEGYYALKKHAEPRYRGVGEYKVFIKSIPLQPTTTDRNGKPLKKTIYSVDHIVYVHFTKGNKMVDKRIRG